jgi:large subunit ribosomal protein L18
MDTRIQQRHDRRIRRHRRVRAKVTGTAGRPRLSIYRSLRSISAQLIDDQAQRTLLGVHERELEQKGTKTERARALGVLLAKKAMDQQITSVVFDRGGWQYHGRVRAFAEGAREGGLQF